MLSTVGGVLSKMMRKTPETSFTATYGSSAVPFPDTCSATKSLIPSPGIVSAGYVICHSPVSSTFVTNQKLPVVDRTRTCDDGSPKPYSVHIPRFVAPPLKMVCEPPPPDDVN